MLPLSVITDMSIACIDSDDRNPNRNMVVVGFFCSHELDYSPRFLCKCNVSWTPRYSFKSLQYMYKHLYWTVN